MPAQFAEFAAVVSFLVHGFFYTMLAVWIFIIIPAYIYDRLAKILRLWPPLT
jgi:hypothetical protein